jgi:hypothetical protein
MVEPAKAGSEVHVAVVAYPDGAVLVRAFTGYRARDSWLRSQQRADFLAKSDRNRIRYIISAAVVEGDPYVREGR